MESTQNEATNVAQEVPSQAGTEAQAGVEVPKVDLGDSETFSRDQVQEIVNNALKSEIVGLKSNNQALKDEKKKAQDRIREYSDLLSGLGGEEGINQLQALKQKIDQDEELRLFTTGDREKYNDRILNRARQDHANQIKMIQETVTKFQTTDRGKLISACGTGKTLTGVDKDMRRLQTGAGSRFDRQMDVNLKGLRQFPKLLKFIKFVGRTGPLAALFGIGEIIQMASTGTLNAKSLTKIFAGLIGGVAGTKLGAAIGSFFPGPGTLIGGLLGGGIGFFAGEMLAEKLANFLLGTDDGEFKKAGNPRAARAQAAAVKRGERLAESYKKDPLSGIRNQFESNRAGGSGTDIIDPIGNPTSTVISGSYNTTNNYSNASSYNIDNSSAFDKRDSLGAQLSY